MISGRMPPGPRAYTRQTCILSVNEGTEQTFQEAEATHGGNTEPSEVLVFSSMLSDVTYAVIMRKVRLSDVSA